MSRKLGKSNKLRKKSINYSHLPDVESISHGNLYVTTTNVFIYQSLQQAYILQNEKGQQKHSISEIFTVPKDNVILLESNPDSAFDSSKNYRKCMLPMPGWIFFPQTTQHASIQTRPYGLLAIQNHPIRRKTKMMESQEEKPNIISQCLHSGFMKNIVLYFRMHPWLPNLIILFIQAGIEIVIFLDIILDLIVIQDLYDSTWTFTFTFACVLLLSPYFIAWSVLFKFIEKNYDNKRYQFFTFLFTISPLGLLIIIINDIYHVLECVFLKPIHFIVTCGRKFRSESFEELGYYKFRRVSEIFSESLMQAIMQLYILINLKRNPTEAYDEEGHKEFKREVHPVTVIMAFTSSIFIILLWMFILIIESKKNGMTFVEYVTVVFQGSFKFVPYLPAIMRGKKTGEKVNWIYFRVRNSSVGTICSALLDPKCVLEVVKLSGYSVKTVSRAGCKFLGNVLRTSRVELILSQKESHIKDLFDAFDITKSGSFNFMEFSRVMLVMRSFRAYSTNHKLLYSRMGSKRRQQDLNENYDHEFSESYSEDDETIHNGDDSIQYESESDEKRDVYQLSDKMKDAKDEESADQRQSIIDDQQRSDSTWTDTAANVTISELNKAYKKLADKVHKKVWLLDLLIKVRSSTERLPCLDYDTPLYFAVATNNINLVSLLMSYGYHRKNREEFEHCVIECIVNEQFKLALVLCEHEGVPIVVNIRKGYNIKYHAKHTKSSTLNNTRSRARLGHMHHHHLQLNAFVTVTVFEQRARTDVIYQSEGSPVWNHYLLFIIPFDSIDDYLYLKNSWNVELSENPLGQIGRHRSSKGSNSAQKKQEEAQTKRRKGRRYTRSGSVSESQTITRMISSTNRLLLPSQIRLPISTLSTRVSMETHLSTTSPVLPPLPPQRARGDSSSQMYRNMRSLSVYSSNNIIQSGFSLDEAQQEPLFNEVIENFYNFHKKKSFLIDFKLFHHKQHVLGSVSHLQKVRKESNFLFGFNDVELAHMNQNLFHYDEMITEQDSKQSQQIMNTNTLYGGMHDDDAGAVNNEPVSPLVVDDSGARGSYEKHFTTVLNVKRAIFKGHRMKNACLDYKIHLSALKCYELYGLDYIDKSKEDFGDLFDGTKYDDLEKASEPYEDYLYLDCVDNEPQQRNIITRASYLFTGPNAV